MLWLPVHRSLFVAGSGRDSVLRDAKPQIGAGLPYHSVMGPLGLPDTEPSCSGCRIYGAKAGLWVCSRTHWVFHLAVKVFPHFGDGGDVDQVVLPWEA